MYVWRMLMLRLRCDDEIPARVGTANQLSSRATERRHPDKERFGLVYVIRVVDVEGLHILLQPILATEHLSVRSAPHDGLFRVASSSMSWGASQRMRLQRVNRPLDSAANQVVDIKP
jgi:hypothetical protein